ncbi:MAG: acyl-CoA dehydrogenase [Saprospiraceae bacterium]
MPFLYAAWSDRKLTATEARALRERAGHLDFLTEDERRVLAYWSDPATPPDRELFKQWEIESRRAATAVGSDELPRLSTLGIYLAKAGDGKNGRDWETYRPTLEAIEKDLGAISPAVMRSLYPNYDQRLQLRDELARASFAPDELRKILDAPYGEIAAELRTLLTRPPFDRSAPRIKEEYRELVLDWCSELARRGYAALAYPEEYGGKNSMGAYATVFEMTAYRDISLTIKFGVQFGLWGGAVANLGTEYHHRNYLPATGRLDLAGCFAMTETGHGSNVRGLETTATYLPETDEIEIHSPSREAGKEYIGNAMHAQVAAVFAQLMVNGENHGVHAIVVPLRDENHHTLPGIRVEDNGYKLGLNGVDNGRIWFTHVRVPRTELLDRFGGIGENGAYHSTIENPSRRFFTMLGTLVGGRVVVPRAGLSATKAALTIAIRYGLKRRQFAASSTDPETLILDYPNQQRRLLPRLAKTYALQFALDYLLDRYVNRTEDDMREIESLAAGLKAYATWFTSDTIQECREATGGKGYLAENRLADLRADTDIFTTFEGDNTVLMQLLAKGILSDFRKQFQEDGNLAVLRYLGRRISTVVMEQNPVAVRQTDRAHLTHPDFYQTAFHFRSRRLTASLAQRLRAYIKDGLSAYEAGLRCQTHMMKAAEAYVEVLVIDQFRAAVERLPEGGERKILDKLCQLYALHTIEGHRGWYLEQGYLAGQKSKAVRKAVEVLCAEVRPEAAGLTAAFGIPDELLAAPIALV